jgi:flagellar L-ring protein precursor FlgH
MTQMTQIARTARPNRGPTRGDGARRAAKPRRLRRSRLAGPVDAGFRVIGVICGSLGPRGSGARAARAPSRPPTRGVTARLMTAAALALSLLSPAGAALAGQKKDEAKVQAPGGTDNYDELMARYLAAARATRPAETGGWMNALMGDLRARHVNDIVTVRVEEVITAAGTADSSLSKDGSGSLGVASFFGAENLLTGVVDSANLVKGKVNTDFKGAGTTTRAGTLTAMMAARVVEVLPNGDLVLEGVREIEINGDRQIVVLTGVARVVDIYPNNEISSSAIGQLRIRYFGKGLMKDSLSPGWLIRILNKIF